MNEQAADSQTRNINIQKMFVKDLSFESPATPQAFATEKWNPSIDLNLTTSNRQVGDNTHEVILKLTIEAKQDESSIFLIELQQAGLFSVVGFDEEDTKRALGSFCPSVLFPYARETIAGVVQKGGFPELVLQPLDFDAVYRQAQQAQEAQQVGNA